VNRDADATRSQRLCGFPIVLIEQDNFLAGYLRATLQRHGAIVTSARGTVEEIISVLREARPRPVVAAVDFALVECGELATVLAQIRMPYLVVAQCPPPPLSDNPEMIPLWRWPFGAFQIVDALADLVEARQECCSPQ
jgi:hypothetical protein